MKKALIIMDMQEVSAGCDHAAFFKYNSGLLERVNTVIDSSGAELAEGL